MVTAVWRTPERLAVQAARSRASRAQAVGGPLPLRRAKRHGLQQPRRTGAELAELVEHEGHKPAALGADAGLVLAALAGLHELDRAPRPRAL